MGKKIVRASVRDIAEFSLRSGNIEKGRGSIRTEDVLDGTKCHTEFQERMKEESGINVFSSEVFTKTEVENNEIKLKISGRMDGLLESDDSAAIYEIKSTSREPESIGEDQFPAHWAQAECYAWMYLNERNYESISIVLVYINRDTRQIKEFKREYNKNKAEERFFQLVDPYLEWMAGIRKWEILRDASIRAMEFPFSEYRLGQRRMAENTYISIRDNTRLFVQAPTGIGKTMGVLFPAIKAIGEGLADRIFYLTAKTVTASIAVDGYKILAENGLNLRVLQLTAKDKVCPLEKRNCDPEYCERARNYYDRLPPALEELLTNQFIDRNVAAEYADRYNICPFELSLDASLYCDMIIGDYNYLFDPRVRLLRFFENVGERYCFLVDEAHNLVDRARQMYSCTMEKRKILELKRNTDPKWDDLKKRLENVNKHFLALKKEYFTDSDSRYHAVGDIPGSLVTSIRRCLTLMEFYLEHEMDDQYNELFMDMYFNMMFFIKVSELYDDHYATFHELHGSDLHIKLMCLDPSKLLSKAMDKGVSTILFSATLEPASYYSSILGGRDIDRSMNLPSPFPVENLNVIVEGRISTKYRNRHKSYESIARLIYDSFNHRKGNYMVYFTSYRYLRDVLSSYELMEPDVEIMVQSTGMSETERETFLERFETHGTKTLVAFAVMGGIFGEGIDLAGERLSGVIIAGTGLPAVCPERELIRNYYNEANGMGFDYAYTFPGLNRVLQAAGRVIRSEYDTGFVILVDDRFAGYRYRNLFPHWWRPNYMMEYDEDVTDYMKV